MVLGQERRQMRQSMATDGAYTLRNVTDDGSLSIPNLKRFGLYNILDFHVDSLASWGKMIPHSIGKSTVEGHWEMMGQTNTQSIPDFPSGFPKRASRCLF